MLKKKNYLLEKIIEILKQQPYGNVLDMGCGDGDFSYRIKLLGFNVVASDLDRERFKYHGRIEFRKTDLNSGLPFGNNSFNYVICLETIEHLENPYFVFREINRVLENDGILLLSTPNIMNLKSRIRFLFEGNFDFFREPPLDQVSNPKDKSFNVHVFSWRYHELEFALYKSGFSIKEVMTSMLEPQAKAWSLLIPIIKLQAFSKCRRSLKKGGIDYSRIYNIALSKELLFGRHLIVKAVKRNRSKI